MASVTIKGSITPSSRLPRGEHRTVQDTPAVRKFIADGWADLVEEHSDTPEPEGKIVSPEPPAPEPTPEPEPEPAPPVAEPTPSAPNKNATRQEWASWLTKYGIVYPPTTNRDQMVGLWERYLDEHPEG